MSLPRKKVSTLTTSSSLSKINSNNTQNINNNRKKGLTKPGWDSTNSNLDQYKQTHDELERRKVSHQSKNLDFIKHEKQRQSILKTKKSSSNQHIDSKVQLALLKEILFDDDQFKNILLKSDATLKNAANLIENDGLLNKKTAKINFTSAPNTDPNDSVLPQETIKQSSNKVNIKNLNNSISDVENEENDENEKLNINDLDELEKYFNNQINDDVLIKMINQENDKNSEDENFNRPINDTTKINRIKSRINKESQFQAIQQQSHINNSNMSLNDFKKVLEELENQLIEYEEQTGRQQSAQRISRHDTFSSYTISLVNVVSSLLHHLKQTTMELQTEKQKFVECAKQLDIHRKLIDGLTTEILTVKNQNEKIINQFATYQAKIETEMDQLRLTIKSTSNYENFLSKTTDTNRKVQSAVQQVSKILPNSNTFTQQRSLISPAINEQVNDFDRFSERLNAMLQTDIIPGTITPSNISNSSNSLKLMNQTNSNKIQQSNLQLNNQINENKTNVISGATMSINNNNRPTSSLSRRSDNIGVGAGSNYYDFDSFLSMQHQSAPVSSSANNSRPTSAQPLGYHQQQALNNNYNANIATLLNTNKQIINEFNSQIQDLSLKNLEAQQKLKHLQQKQELNVDIENEFALKFPETMQHFESIENQQTLNKLKEDQNLLKEQILLLNKQRELAQKELDKIVSTNSNTLSSLNSLNTIGITSLSSKSNNRSSPNLSPIPTETEAIFPDGLDIGNNNQNYFVNSESDQLEITPPRNMNKFQS